MPTYAVRWTQPSVGLLSIRVQAYLWPGKPQMTPQEALAVLQQGNK